MNINIPAQFRGTYEFILKRKDGSVQKETVHNIATSNIVNASHSSALNIGSGSGTPSSADTKLFNHKWNIAASIITHVQNIGENGASMNLTYIVPATSSYVATITEVGMGDVNSIYTHAMLVDAEGNPISIIKTENDELTINVTLELYTSTTLPLTLDFSPFVSVSRKPTLAALLLSHIVNSHRYITVLTGDDDKSTNYRSALMLSVKPRNMLLPYRGTSGSNGGVDPEYLPFNGNKSMMRKELIGNLRCRNDSFNTHYYRYLQFSLAWSYSGYTHVSIPMALDLKDPNIFPPQLLSNIAIGVGDGQTAEFACPLNYFQKDTEVIYKNGVALTRGVDYTIDNESNKDCLPELMHIIYPDDVEIKITGVSNGGSYFQFQPEAYVQPSNYATYDYSKVCTAFDSDHPLHFDWGAARKVNRLRGTLHARYTKTMYVEYSADNVTWEEAASMSIQSSSASTITQFPVDLTWNEVEARYWRIRVEKYGTSTTSNHTAYFSTGGAEPYLGHSNPRGITFAVPPAESDVLTMDCYLDIPLKSSNFAFNLALDLTLTYS